MAGQLNATAQFFNKTWASRFGDIEVPAEAQTVLGKIIEGTKEGRRKKVEQTVRAKLLDQMAELTARRAGSTDKEFNANIAPVLRGMGKLIAQKDQSKFFKQLKDFDDALFALHAKDKATAKKIRENLGLDEEEELLEDINEKEQKSLKDLQLTKDLKGTLINLLGPAGPFVHTLRGLKHEYGDGFSKVWGKLKGIVEAREQARSALDNERDRREFRFGKFVRVVKTGLAKVKIVDFFKRITPSKSTIINLGKSLINPKLLGATLGAASMYRVLGRNSHGAQAAEVPHATATGSSTADAGAASVTPLSPMPAEAERTDDGGFDNESPSAAPPAKQDEDKSKGLIADAKDAIVQSMGDFGGWFKDKWQGLSDWFMGNPLVMGSLSFIKEGKDYLLKKTAKLFGAVPDMLRSVFRSIYEMVPAPIRTGIDWALKLGGKSLEFFSKLLSGDTPVAAPEYSGAVAQPVAAEPPMPAGAATADTGSSGGDFPGLKLKPNANVAGLQGPAKTPLLAMAQDYFGKTGKTLQINTAKRSTAEQIALYTDGKHKAARPGTSMHEYGYAIDMHSPDANKLDSMGLLSKYGFVRPVSGEPWHLEPASIQALKATIRKKAPGAEGDGQKGGSPTASAAYAAQPVKATSNNAANQGRATIGGAPDVSHIQAAAPGSARVQQMPDRGTGVYGSETTTASARMQDEQYSRAASFNRRPALTVQAEDEEPDEATLTGAAKSSMDGISFYIGDFTFLALNMGLTEA